MRTGLVLWKLILLATAASFPSAPARAEEVVVTASAARPAIERILHADNLDVERLSAREVADAMADIPRGRAPASFWQAYQAHVSAWQDYAAARERFRGAAVTDIDKVPDGATIAAAQRRINATFDTVEKIARRYGARLPITPTRVGG